MSVGRAKQWGGVLAAAAGFVTGFVVLVVCKLPVGIAAAITTLDIFIGAWVFWAGTKQIKRERATKVIAFPRGQG